MIWRYMFILFLPMMAFASDGSNYDILERALNFALFAGLLYWLLKDKIVKAHEDRISSIADKLEQMQTALKDSARKKELAKQKVEAAKESAKSIASVSKKETELLIKKMNEDVEIDLANLEKSYQEKILVERRRMRRDVISEILNEMFEGSSLDINKEEFVNIILKKVA